jgi:HK97 family phage prohead protease
MNRKTRSFRVSLKEQGEGDGNERTFEGYASTFDREPDSYGDVIAPGAFADTLKAFEDQGRRIPLLFGHVMDDPDYNLGYVDASEDEKGLHVVGHIFMDTPKGETVYQLLKRGQVDRMSFAYDVLDDGVVTLEDGTKAHELRKLDLFECSIVTVPANEHAEITEVKSGRRNSKADEDRLSSVRDALQGALDTINDLIGDEGDEPAPSGDGEQAQGDEGGDGDGSKAGDADREALEELRAKFARFID